VRRLAEGVIGTGVALVVKGLAFLGLLLVIAAVIAAVMAFNDWKRARR
jgi:hypothetical protein